MIDEVTIEQIENGWLVIYNGDKRKAFSRREKLLEWLEEELAVGGGWYETNAHKHIYGGAFGGSSLFTNLLYMLFVPI